MYAVPVNGLQREQASVTSDTDVLADINVDTYPDGASVNLEAVFGNTIEYDSSGSVTGAEAMVQVTC